MFQEPKPTFWSIFSHPIFTNFVEVQNALKTLKNEIIVAQQLEENNNAVSAESQIIKNNILQTQTSIQQITDKINKQINAPSNLPMRLQGNSSGDNVVNSALTSASTLKNVLLGTSISELNSLQNISIQIISKMVKLDNNCINSENIHNYLVNFFNVLWNLKFDNKITNASDFISNHFNDMDSKISALKTQIIKFTTPLQQIFTKMNIMSPGITTISVNNATSVFLNEIPLYLNNFNALNQTISSIKSSMNNNVSAGLPISTGTSGLYTYLQTLWNQNSQLSTTLNTVNMNIANQQSQLTSANNNLQTILNQITTSDNTLFVDYLNVITNNKFAYNNQRSLALVLPIAMDCGKNYLQAMNSGAQSFGAFTIPTTISNFTNKIMTPTTNYININNANSALVIQKNNLINQITTNNTTLQNLQNTQIPTQTATLNSLNTQLSTINNDYQTQLTTFKTQNDLLQSVFNSVFAVTNQTMTVATTISTLQQWVSDTNTVLQDFKSYFPADSSANMTNLQTSLTNLSQAWSDILNVVQGSPDTTTTFTQYTSNVADLMFMALQNNIATISTLTPVNIPTTISNTAAIYDGVKNNFNINMVSLVTALIKLDYDFITNYIVFPSSSSNVIDSMNYYIGIVINRMVTKLRQANYSPTLQATLENTMSYVAQLPNPGNWKVLDLLKTT
jgi:predicted  nucleic acid-binding Zn-ribbon protein